MFNSKLLIITLVFAFFQGANNCAADAHTSPGIGAHQSEEQSKKKAKSPRQKSKSSQQTTSQAVPQRQTQQVDQIQAPQQSQQARKEAPAQNQKEQEQLEQQTKERMQLQTQQQAQQNQQQPPQQLQQQPQQQPQQLSHSRHGTQSYTLIFCDDGIAKGDVAADKSATVVGAANSVVATSEKSLKLMCGSCMVVTANNDVKVDLSNSDSVIVSAHGKVVLSKVDENVYLVVKSGSATVTQQAVVSNLPAGSAVVIDKGTINNAISETTEQLIFSDKTNKSMSEPVRLLADDGTKFAIKEGNLWLKNASAFVEMPAGVKLVTPGGTIHSAHPYTISCRMVDESLCVENCSPLTIVEMSVKNENFRLAPFKSCSLRHGDETQAKLPDDGLLRRDAVAESDGKVTAMVSEYDPLSLLEAHEQLKRAVSKPITLHQQKTCEALFKSIAVFEELCGDVDSFEENPSIEVRSVKGRIKAKATNIPPLSLANADKSNKVQ